ncbi:GNAT family N-acetyltransferase [Paenibacillus dakarensis]|uniref:GNAT family N-acetyltransferase n=1 Tax=Paenibacillus dakarensis TaxID=1527293 RepID=UPI0006D57469|nr:GNAT family N-acetyltransferase [Paenibacillus dakarensis]
MDISLFKAGRNEAAIIHEMQIKAFKPLLDTYQDHETSPANESVERIVDRLNQFYTEYYIIKNMDTSVGAIRIVSKDNHTYKISPIFILPEYQGKGIAQHVLSIVEEIYNDAKVWELVTILQDHKLCYIYEKLGYQQTGQEKPINDRMTLVFYKKNLSE